MKNTFKKQISKKRSFLITMVKQSEMVQTILIILGIVLVITADYFLARWECSVLAIEEMKTESITLLMIANPFLCALIASAGYFLIQLLTDIFYGIKTGIKKLRAIYRYCFIPLTETEVRKCGFTSSDEYINYILDALQYGSCGYVSVKDEDVTKILTVCIKVFPKNDLFKLSHDTVERLCDYRFDTCVTSVGTIVNFINHYEETEEKKVLSKEIYIVDDRIALSFTTKKDKHKVFV